MGNSLDSTLKRIIETDKASRERIQEKKQRLISLDTEIAKSKEEIDAELLAQSNKNIKKATESAEIKLKKEITRIDTFYEEAEANLRGAFNDRHEDIANKIFKSIIE